MGVGQASVPPRSKTRRRRRRVPGKRRSIRSPPTILPGGRRWRMPRRPAPQSSQSRLLPRGARPSSGYNPSPTSGIAHVSCGGAGMTLRGSLCSPLRTWIRRGTGAPLSNSACWPSGRCGRRCPSWPRTCPVLPGYVLSFLAPRCPSSEPSRSSLTYVLLIQELEARSLEKSMLLRRERDVWD